MHALLSCEETKAAYKTDSCCADKPFTPYSRANQACSCGLATDRGVETMADSFQIFHYETGSKAAYDAFLAQQASTTYSKAATKLSTGRCSYVTEDHSEVMYILRVPYAKITDSNYLTELVSLPPADGPEMNLVDVRTIYSPMAQDTNAERDAADDTLTLQLDEILAQLGFNYTTYRMNTFGVGDMGFGGKGVVEIVMTDTAQGYKESTDEKLVDLFGSQALITGTNEELNKGITISFASEDVKTDGTRFETEYIEYGNSKLLEVFSAYPEIIAAGFQVIQMNEKDAPSALVQPPPKRFKTIPELEHICLF